MIDGDGRKLAEWTLGTLPGLAGSVEQIAVVGAGPSRLPAPRKPHTWEVVGRLTTSQGQGRAAGERRDRAVPVAGPRRPLPAGPVRPARRRARPDGLFRLPRWRTATSRSWCGRPRALEDCDGPFTVNSHWLAPVTDCPADKPRPRHGHADQLPAVRDAAAAAALRPGDHSARCAKGQV